MQLLTGLKRNMLAIKFHHLRALIHRPYLSIPLLRDLDHDSMNMSQNERFLVERYEKTCVSEAQGTAHLLRNVADQRELVYDFPWWQMISCLICASSILLVASIFTRRKWLSDEDEGVAVLDDDAETCLKVFEALSANSDGARIARDMMARLRECGNKWSKHYFHRYPWILWNTMYLTYLGEARMRGGTEHPSHSVIQMHTPQSQPVMDVSGGHDEPTLTTSHFDDGVDGSALLFNEHEWPSEIMDSMAWSAQIYDAVHNSQFPLI